MNQFLITLLLELTPVDLIYTRIDFSEKNTLMFHLTLLSIMGHYGPP